MRMIRRAQEVTCHRAVPVATGAPTLIIVTVTGVTVTCCSDGASSSVVCLWVARWRMVHLRTEHLARLHEIAEVAGDSQIQYRKANAWYASQNACTTMTAAGYAQHMTTGNTAATQRINQLPCE
jgi:hypothetical protein